jgi:FixJ family two-component response regulator
VLESLENGHVENVPHVKFGLLSETSIMEQVLTIFVVDDDPAVSDAIQGVCDLQGWPVERFASAEAFADSHFQSRPGCLILDLKLPGLSGLDLQSLLSRRAPDLPVILISGHADVDSAVTGMRNGALTLLQKPFNSRQITSAIEEALGRVRRRSAERAARDVELALLAGLTDAELETARMIVDGKSNKQVAALTGLSIRGVEDRRRRLKQHFGVRSLAEFVTRVKPLLMARDSGN